MNRKLLNLVKFIKKTNCERHFIDNGLKFILFLNGDDLPDFCEIIELIEDKGYDAVWKGGYFCIDIAPFVEDCEVLSLNEFVELVGKSR